MNAAATSGSPPEDASWRGPGDDPHPALASAAVTARTAQHLRMRGRVIISVLCSAGFGYKRVTGRCCREFPRRSAGHSHLPRNVCGLGARCGHVVMFNVLREPLGCVDADPQEPDAAAVGVRGPAVIEHIVF